MSYEEIAQAMETSVPSVKSLLVRARISLAEASQARQLTCGEVRIDLAEAAEGLRKLSGPVRRHVRDCEECADFRSQLRSNDKVLAALVPAGPLLALKGFIFSKLGLGGAGTGGAATATGAGATGAGAVGSVGAALSSGGAAGGLGAVGGAIGTKAVAGVVTAAVITAGAVEVKQQAQPGPAHSNEAAISRVVTRPGADGRGCAGTQARSWRRVAPRRRRPQSSPRRPKRPRPRPKRRQPRLKRRPPKRRISPAKALKQPLNLQLASTAATPSTGVAGAPAAGGTVVVTVGGSPTSSEPAPAPAPAPPAEATPPPAESTPPPPAESPPPEPEGSTSEGLG